MGGNLHTGAFDLEMLAGSIYGNESEPPGAPAVPSVEASPSTLSQLIVPLSRLKKSVSGLGNSWGTSTVDIDVEIVPVAPCLIMKMLLSGPIHSQPEQILTKSNKNNQIHFESLRSVIFSDFKISNSRQVVNMCVSSGFKKITP